MVRSSEPDRAQALWAAALRDAAGPLSAYITPTAFALENVSVQRILDAGTEDFAAEIEARLDLGRADAFLQLLRESDFIVTTAYRHVLSWSQGAVRGKIHIPRFVLGIARNETRGIPVIRARRQVTTPENLLVSEAFRLCIAAAEFWKLRGGAEAQYAAGLWSGLQSYESTFPWNELRTKARPSLAELVGVVDGRIRAGQVEPGTFYERVALLFSERSDNSSAFEKAATPISMLLTQAPEFEDRVFELLCLSWMISTLRSYCSNVVVNPIALRGQKKGPIATGWLGEKRFSLFYQQSAALLPVPTWVDRHTHQPLRALPDVVLKISDGDTERLVILDAKNRTVASESDVAYKLMGYKENLGIESFQAVGMYPSFSGRLRLRRLEKGGEQILLVHVPLSNGRRTVRRIARQFLGVLETRPGARPSGLAFVGPFAT
jgi:hypothetical protein